MENIIIDNGCTTESVISQLQKHKKQILAVRNHKEVLSYKNLSSLPNNLVFENTKRNDVIGTVEYMFKCAKTGNIYVFFLDSAREELIYRSNSTFTVGLRSRSSSPKVEQTSEDSIVGKIISISAEINKEKQRSYCI